MHEISRLKTQVKSCDIQRLCDFLESGNSIS